jgi:hypothetical protein
MLPSNDGTLTTFFLRSFANKASKAVSHQLYVSFTYDAYGWRSYQQAFDDHATAHGVTKIDRDGRGCGGRRTTPCVRSEDIGVEITDEQMRAFATTGAEFKIEAQSGDSLIFNVKPTLFMAQLAALNPYLGAPYAIDQTKMAPAPLGAVLADYGGFNRRLYFGLDHGVQLLAVEADSVAAKAGLGNGDWVLEIDGTPLKTKAQAQALFDGAHYGQTVKAMVKRKGQISSVDLRF